MRSLIERRPFLAAVFCWSSGVQLAVVSGCPFAIWGLAAVILGLGWMAFPRWRERTSLFFVGILLAVIGAGWGVVQRDGYRSDQVRLDALNRRTVAFCGVVTEEAYWSRWGWRVPFRIESVGGRPVTSFTTEWKLPLTVSPPIPGTLIKMRGRWRPGTVESYPTWQERRGYLGKVQTGSWKVLGRRATLQAWLYDIKRRLESLGERTLSRRSAELLHGMLFGEEITDPAVTEDFRRSGAIHLLSVGGLHIGFLTALLAGFGLAMRLPQKAVMVGVLIILPLFILMVGAKPPVLRAGLVSGLILIGYLLERPVDGLNLWGAAAFTILLFKPLELYDPGFQLSFAASGGILWLFPRWRRMTPAKLRPLTDPIYVSIAAQIGVLPLMAFYFGNISWVSVFANMAVIPLSTIAVQLGALAEVLGMIWTPITVLINTANELMIRLLILLIEWFSDWGGMWPLPVINGWGMLLYYLGIFAALRLREVNPITRMYRTPIWIQLMLLSAVIVAAAGWGYAQRPPDRLRVEVLDVGQGDSIVVSAPGGKRMLVDGGPGEAYENSLKPYIRRHMIQRFDIVILTHAHEDHVGGLVKLLENREIAIGQILDPGVPHTSRVYQRFLRTVLKRKIPYAKAYRGISFPLGYEVNARILWPRQGMEVRGHDLNHGSVVMRLDYQKRGVLLMGDADAAAERELLELGTGELRAQILKVGHHGSAYSSLSRFLQAVHPKIAVISVGKGNSFGHPNRGVMKRLNRVGAHMFRTDHGGQVTIDFANRSQVKVRRGTL